MCGLGLRWYVFEHYHPRIAGLSNACKWSTNYRPSKRRSGNCGWKRIVQLATRTVVMWYHGLGLANQRSRFREGGYECWKASTLLLRVLDHDIP